MPTATCALNAYIGISWHCSSMYFSPNFQTCKGSMARQRSHICADLLFFLYVDALYYFSPQRHIIAKHQCELLPSHIFFYYWSLYWHAKKKNLPTGLRPCSHQNTVWETHAQCEVSAPRSECSCDLQRVSMLSYWHTKRRSQNKCVCLHWLTWFRSTMRTSSSAFPKVVHASLVVRCSATWAH